MTVPRRAALLAGLAPLLPRPGLAQADPLAGRQVRIVIAFAPGGSVDLLARILARGMAERLGTAVVAENRSGAAGNVAAEHVARSAPDGTTLLFTAEPLVVNPAVHASVPYDAVASFAPVNLSARLTQALVVGNGQPMRDLGGFLAQARERQGALNIGSGGSGSPGHVVCGMLGRAGVPVTHVPYRGGGPATQGVIAGEIEAAVITLPGVYGHVQQGAVRLLAVTSPGRVAQVPQTPAMAEALPGLVVESWHALFAPAGTPAPVVRRLHEAAAAALGEAATRAQLLGRGFDPEAGPPEALAALVRDDLVRWRAVVAELGIKAD
jgi:tripartite-type tricarboxylate transporter receptor subunit TctC